MGEMVIGCHKKGQDKERVCKRDGKNCKVGRQTSGHKVTLVWTREEKRRLRREKMIKMVIPGKRRRRPKRR